jgi:hypothetical protein
MLNSEPSTDSSIRSPSTPRYTYQNRPAKRVRQERSRRRVTRTWETAMKARETVLAHCVENVKFYTIAIALFVLRLFVDLGTAARKQFLFDHCKTRATQGYFVINVHLHDGALHLLRLCNGCFAAAIGKSRTTIQRYLRRLRTSKHRRPLVSIRAAPSRMPTMLANIAFTWIAGNVRTYGDYMPDNMTVMLPVYNKKEYFRWFKTEVPRQSFEYAAFLKMLRDQLPFIIFRKCSPFTKCAHCDFLDQQAAKAKVN